MHYSGRFAPSPTGPLHLGSLVAAVGSYLDARAVGGRWSLRIEDIDTPRVVEGADRKIIETLRDYGFEWDGPILWQSRRIECYRAAFNRLSESGAIFACACSRKEIADSALSLDGARRYPGTCRHGVRDGRLPRAWRVRSQPGEMCFIDRVQGRFCEDVFRDVGDFVVVRADGLFAYQLAVVVDDAEQGFTHIVRGADLLHSTARQIFLQQLLGCSTPFYAHLPVATAAGGEKLSKQTLAPALDNAQPQAAIVRVLDFLGQHPPPGLDASSVREVWDWAIAHWNIDAVPRRSSKPFE